MSHASPSGIPASDGCIFVSQDLHNYVSALLLYFLSGVQSLEFTPVQVNATGASTNWQQSSSESYAWYLDARLIVNGVTENTAAAKVSIGAGPNHLGGSAFVPLDESGLYVLTGRSTADDSFIQNSDHFDFVASSGQDDDADSTTVTTTTTVKTTPTQESTTSPVTLTSSTRDAVTTSPHQLVTTTQSFSSDHSSETSHSFADGPAPSNSESTSGFITSKTSFAQASSSSASGTSDLPISQSSGVSLPTSNPSASGTPDNLTLKIAIPLSIILAILLGFLLFFCLRRRKRQHSQKPPFVVDRFVVAPPPSRLLVEDRKVERFGPEGMTVQSETEDANRRTTAPVSPVSTREDTVVASPTGDPALRQEVTILRAELLNLREQMQDLVTEPPPSYVHSS